MPNEKKFRKEIANVSKLSRAIAEANTPEEILDLEAKLDGFEQYMRKAGLYRIAEIRPVNEAKMRARWRLGQMLAALERGAGPGRGKKKDDAHPSFLRYLKELKLDKAAAISAQRIGTLPATELEKAFAGARENDILCTYDELIQRARPYWYKASREKKHRNIRDTAKTVAATSEAEKQESFGPFPLIYADPPWKFEIYSEKGLEHAPDQHYPTLTDQEIIDFKIHRLRVGEVAHRDAVLLLWCTSSNIVRALDVLDGWGFTYKAHAVWVKDKKGLGLVFRNQHEVLLYGTRGKMPGPQYQPPSVFAYPRGRHSAKPPEIRKEIEKMYPDFDAATRLEMFSREPGVREGWTHVGFEAGH